MPSPKNHGGIILSRNRQAYNPAEIDGKNVFKKRVYFQKVGPGSSEGERPAEDRVVVGSNPTRGIALKITFNQDALHVNPAQLRPPTS